MFSVSPVAQKYIMKKGGDVRLYLKTYHSQGG